MIVVKKKEPGSFKNLIKIMSAIVDECKFTFTKSAISIKTIDDGRICLLSVKLDGSDLDELQVTKEESIGLNVEDLAKILERSRKTDSLELSYNGEDKKLKIVFRDTKEEDKHKREFNLQTIDLGDSGIKPEALESISYPGTIVIEPEYLDEAIKDADIYAETIQIDTQEKHLKFIAEGTLGSMNAVFEKTDAGIREMIIEDGFLEAYSLSYLKKIIKSKEIAEKIELCLKSNTPICIKCPIWGNSYIWYFLAPRIEEPDEEEEDS